MYTCYTSKPYHILIYTYIYIYICIHISCHNCIYMYIHIYTSTHIMIHKSWLLSVGVHTLRSCAVLAYRNEFCFNQSTFSGSIDGNSG